jgi:hypothetical protein
MQLVPLRHELDSPDAEMTFKGVVFNEMKAGARSCSRAGDTFDYTDHIHVILQYMATKYILNCC